MTAKSEPSEWTRDAIHAFLSVSYWAAGIPQTVVERALRNSLSVGLYDISKGGRAPDRTRASGD